MSRKLKAIRPSGWSVRGRGIAVAALSAALLAGCAQSPEDMLTSAKSYLEKQDLSAASIQLKNALQENGNLAEARFLLGSIHVRQGDAVAAVKELQRARDLGYPQEQVAPLLARALFGAGELDKLLADFSDTRLTDGRGQAAVLAALGDAHLARRDVDKARAAYVDALAADAGQTEARIGLARTHILKQDLKAAEDEVREAIRRKPDSAEAHATLSDVLMMRDEPEQSLLSLREAIRLAPGAVNYHFAHVSQLLQQGKRPEAEKALEAMQANAPNHPSTRYLKALLDYQSDRLTEARDTLMQVLKDAPQYLPAELLAGTVLVRLNDHVLGRAHLARVLERVPGEPTARRTLVASHLATGEAERALEQLQPLLQVQDPDARLLGLAGQVFLANGDFERAEEYLERAARAAPEDAQARMRLGVARMAGGDAEAAFADLENAAQMDDSAFQADLALVMAHLRRGETDKALEAHAQLERKQPDNPLVHNLRGGLMLAKRDIPAARAAFEKALALRPDYLSAAVNLARLDLAERRPDDALGRVRAVVERNPKNVEALLTLAELQRATGAASADVFATLERAEAASPGAVAPSLAIVQHHLRQREFARALQVAQKVAVAHPADLRVVEALGRAQLAAGDSQQAISAFNKLAGLMPRSPQPLVMLADVHRSLKNNDAAEQALRRALTIAPDALEAQRRLVALLLEGGKRDAALRLAREAQARQPQRAGGYVLEGEIHGTDRKWAEAAGAYRKALDNGGGGQAAIRLHAALLRGERKAEAERVAADWLASNPTDLAMRGYLAERALAEKRYQDAGALFGKMHEMAPQNALILNNLAWTARELGDPKALDYAEQALRLAPENPAIIDTVGMIQVARGEFDAGIANLERAVALGPDLLPLQLNLAKALAKAGRSADARTRLDALLPRLKEGSPLHGEALALQKTL